MCIFTLAYTTGPKYYYTYTKSVGEIVKRRKINYYYYYYYANDTQVYVVLKPQENWDDVTSPIKVRAADKGN